MNIPDSKPWDKGRGLKSHISAISQDWVLGAIIVLTGALCLGLGLIIARESPKSEDTLWIEQLPKDEISKTGSTSTGAGEDTPKGSETTKTLPAAVIQAGSASGAYVASKSGSKYYLPVCAGAKRIKDENKVWFATKQEAEKAGYDPATTCKGL